jgi:hypothetical protein
MSDDIVKGYRALYDRHGIDAAASFRFRLREAAKAALTLGDELLQASQDASEPDEMQLMELRDIEESLRCNLMYRMRNIKEPYKHAPWSKP